MGSGLFRSAIKIRAACDAAMKEDLVKRFTWIAVPICLACVPSSPPPTPAPGWAALSDSERTVRIAHVAAIADRDGECHPSRETLNATTARWPDAHPEEVEAIACRRIWVGMSEGMLRASWGSPETVNRTVTSSVVSEQWVYHRAYPHDAYVYVENGVVTALQD